MSNIKLLDCTLRDGGYINDWKFGKNAIHDVIKVMTSGTCDIFEIGFLKNEQYCNNRTVFSNTEQIQKLISPKQKCVKYAAMIEVVNPLPIELLNECDGESIDIIRVIVWKRLLKEGLAYCQEIVNKGYQLCVQPARVDQYSDEEFIDMCKEVNKIAPSAMYVVDSWGTLNVERILHYVDLANKKLNSSISIGYHGHNNLMQAYGTAIQFINMKMEREKIVDASIYGIGRGAGNLNLELIAKYLNDTQNYNYKILPMLDIYDKYLASIYEIKSWGYSISYYLTAVYKCNPNYASYYETECQLKSNQIANILANISKEDKIIFSCNRADEYLKKYVK